MPTTNLRPAPTAIDEAEHARRWKALIVVALGQLLMTLDATIVNVALPTIQDALDISMAARQWVITAYTLTFAGLLLLGGRTADFIGHKRAFLIALAGFAAASVVGGAAMNEAMLLAARAAQGAFAALLAPAALSLLSTTFSDPRERGTAFAVYGAVASSGLPIGMILGGVLAEHLTWRWVLYVNVPIALAALFGAWFLLDERQSRRRARFDVPGALLATGGLTAVVYGFTTAASRGWGSPFTQGILVGGVGLLAAFVFTQARVNSPLLPPRIVAHRGRGGAYLAFLMVFAGIFGLFLLVTFYLQSVQGYSPTATGVAFLPLACGVIGASTLVSRLMTRVQARLLLSGGLLLAATGMAWLTQLQVGVASATLNTSQQVGASLGTALLNTIAASHTIGYLASHPSSPGHQLAAQVHGYTVATAWSAGILTTAALVTLLLVKANLGAVHEGWAGVVRGGVEPPTSRFSVARSTN